MFNSSYIGFLFLIFPFGTIYLFTREKTKILYFNDSNWEVFRKITPFSSKVNYYIWATFIYGGCTFIFICMIAKILYDFGVIK